MTKGKYELWMPLCLLFGATLGSVIMYFVQERFPYEVLAGAIVISSIYFIISLVRR